MKTVIGIDLGGTNIRAALVSAQGRVIKKINQPVGMHRSTRDSVKVIGTIVASLIQSADQKPQAIGVGVAGIVSADQGIVFASPHFPAWKNFSIKTYLQRIFSLPVFVDNDANNAALAEQWKGTAKSWPHFMMLTLGTGIGGALIINSRIVHGDHGFTGEFGHMVIQSDGPPCPCGSRGCFELYASASGLRRQMMKVPGLNFIRKLKPEDQLYALAMTARNSNKSPKRLAALRLFENMGYYLGIGLASLVNVTGVQRIVLGGGLMGASDLFLSAAKKEMKRRIYKKTAEGICIKQAQLGSDAGVLGSAFAALDGLKKS